MIRNEMGYVWRGRLVTNWDDPVEVWACPDCFALVQTTDQVAHIAWHEHLDGRTAGDP